MFKSLFFIDMMLMVDFVFFLVIFFMFLVNFCEFELVIVFIFLLIVDVIIFKNIIMVIIDQGGYLFFNIFGFDVCCDFFFVMGDKYKVKFMQDEVKLFFIMISFGVFMKDLLKYIDMMVDE